MSISDTTIAKARDCYDSFRTRNFACGGCHLDGVCGMGQESARTLFKFMKAIDPDGLNVAMVRLGPIGEGDVR